MDLIQVSDDPDAEPHDLPPNICGDEVVSDDVEELQPTPVTTKKKRGRPKKKVQEEELGERVPPAKRKRGRPKKTSLEPVPEIRRSSRQGRAEINLQESDDEDIEENHDHNVPNVSRNV